MIELIPQELYNSIIANLPIACVDIAIVYDEAVLLVKRRDDPAKGQWWLPGGRVLKGELMRDAAIRKAKEETGVKCFAGPIIHTAETLFPDGPNGIPIHSINSCFFMYPAGSAFKVILDEHQSGYRWIKRIEKNLHPYVVKCLQKIF